MDDNNDWIFQDDWLSCMCAHYQQALLDGDTDNAIGLRVLLDELKIPADVIADIEAFAAHQLSPASQSITEALPEPAIDIAEPPRPDPILAAVTETPVQFAAMDAFPDTLVGVLPNPESETPPESELDQLSASKPIKPTKKPKPDKSQLSLF